VVEDSVGRGACAKILEGVGNVPILLPGEECIILGWIPATVECRESPTADPRGLRQPTPEVARVDVLAELA
jgi:hypothetical protein